jgi:hypothetical protein
MRIIFQITNLKMIRDVLGLRKFYQCGGETQLELEVILGY